MTIPLGATGRLSDESVVLLGRRGLSANERGAFAAILDKAAQQLDAEVTAHQVLQDLSADELEVLRKGHSLASGIFPSGLTLEGALNLLVQPGPTDRVDLNNDGLVEVGTAKIIHFPPVNAPGFVHEAWEKATEGMAMSETMIMQFEMHAAVYGLHIPGYESPEVRSPAEQWAISGVKALLETLRSTLEFQVEREGWTEGLLLKEEVYDRFELELESGRPALTIDD